MFQSELIEVENALKQHSIRVASRRFISKPSTSVSPGPVPASPSAVAPEIQETSSPKPSEIVSTSPTAATPEIQETSSPKIVPSPSKPSTSVSPGPVPASPIPKIQETSSPKPSEISASPTAVIPKIQETSSPKILSPLPTVVNKPPLPSVPIPPPGVIEYIQQYGEKFAQSIHVFDDSVSDWKRKLVTSTESFGLGNVNIWIQNIYTYFDALKKEGLSQTHFEIISSHPWLTLMNMEETLPLSFCFYISEQKEATWFQKEMGAWTSCQSKHIFITDYPTVIEEGLTPAILVNIPSNVVATYTMLENLVDVILSKQNIACPVLYFIQLHWNQTLSLDYAFLLMLHTYLCLKKLRCPNSQETSGVATNWICKGIFYWYIFRSQSVTNDLFLTYIIGFLQALQPKPEPTVVFNEKKKELETNIDLYKAQLRELEKLSQEVEELFQS